jgi:hypothetical protein
MRDNPKPEWRICYDQKTFKDFTRFCENVKKPSVYPCAVRIHWNSGRGHCEDWWSARHVEAPTYDSLEQRETYLKGVMAGWKVLN